MDWDELDREDGERLEERVKDSLCPVQRTRDISQGKANTGRGRRAKTGRTTVGELPNEELLHRRRKLVLVGLLLDHLPELLESLPERLEVCLGVDAGLVH